jgi:hypothetical protein
MGIFYNYEPKLGYVGALIIFFQEKKFLREQSLS